MGWPKQYVQANCSGSCSRACYYHLAWVIILHYNVCWGLLGERKRTVQILLHILLGLLYVRMLGSILLFTHQMLMSLSDQMLNSNLRQVHRKNLLLKNLIVQPSVLCHSLYRHQILGDFVCCERFDILVGIAKTGAWALVIVPIIGVFLRGTGFERIR